jgi:hypothetical protein
MSVRGITTAISHVREVPVEDLIPAALAGLAVLLFALAG